MTLKYNLIFDWLGPRVPHGWKLLVNVPDMVDELMRFSDHRQPVFEEKPLPDGSNLQPGSLTLPWLWSWYRD